MELLRYQEVTRGIEEKEKTHVALSMGEFISKATRVMDEGFAIQLWEDEGLKVYRPIVVDDAMMLFLDSDLKWVMRQINCFFYKCFGGWCVNMEFDTDRIFTGRMAFEPTSK